MDTPIVNDYKIHIKFFFCLLRYTAPKLATFMDYVTAEMDYIRQVLIQEYYYMGLSINYYTYIHIYLSLCSYQSLFYILLYNNKFNLWITIACMIYMSPIYQFTKRETSPIIINQFSQRISVII